MKLFKCSNCGQLVYFENTHCEHCQSLLGFNADDLQMTSILRAEDTFWMSKGNSGIRYRYCANHEYGVCNWLVPAESESPFCKACALNRTIPNLSKPEYIQHWRVIEFAKHRLIYSLLRMKLPLISKAEDAEKGLCFDFVADGHSVSNERILTGHSNGLITLNIAEADDIIREQTRKLMDEMYRTVLGHFRHEIGHYYWERLINNSADLDAFRQLFGDERADYGAALRIHYSKGPSEEWRAHYISSYASVHPWEDWAESWAHYMHIVDTLETAYSFGFSVDPRGIQTAAPLRTEIKADPYRVKDFDHIMQLWLPLTFTMNSISRSMGLQDLYPFIINQRVQEKLTFIHNIINKNGHSSYMMVGSQDLLML
ncbi:putative zinc-binding peptidase [Chitinophagaceae bacterium LB-8]|uniref:Zinc-binding peptidase n=1 Tax=Paraflavisolibacter caeni TaxID=2982496 RepID=A0A9X2XNX4_9BACT|nr:putative zinc-binding peptidase [Paraflavisolibacter caeni]MCU7549344.1 putative zinc-binding peptidase [Paraflavisolibacter caeni]